ncbi:Peptidase family M28 [Thermomonospora echinospora]|uniref:Peptidase family M28 n=1 Tax=Thermomonospora echinospora TaxID=1992 RepID=A0A1H5XGN4_9ACTN|nr:M28 family peptidase [Thermomonospora echinospora]SEG10356.1 Peptidase family M28 [Thermomonospora echinospora]
MPPERFLRPVPTTSRPDEYRLRATVEELATIERPPCSAGEREAAHLIAHRLRMLGCRARVEEEPAFGSYARPVGALAALGALAGLAGGRSRTLGVLGGTLAAAGLADEVSYGRQLARRVVSRRLSACNVVAELGDPRARRTLVVMAHHDAAPSGAIFDQRPARWFARRFPTVVDGMTENPPLWWAALAGPVLAGLGSATGSARMRRTGTVLSAATTAVMADIAARRAVPGANDNLSGVAVLIALAEALRERPPAGLRVVLFSAGAEEALQEGVRGFARRYFPRLPRETTWFLNLDTVGSGNLVMLDAEGPLRMEPYNAAFGDLVARCALEQGVRLRRGLRSRNSTDGVVPNRYGYPTVCVVSVDDEKLLPHYHLPSDLPEHVDYGCVADAARLTEAVVRALADD